MENKPHNLVPIQHAKEIREIFGKESSKLEYEFFKNFRSEHTRRSYKNDILQFLQYLKSVFPDLEGAHLTERAHIVAYRSYLEEKDYAPKTINRKLSSVSSYFDFLVEKAHLPFNPCTSVRRPRQEVQTPTNDLSDEQVRELFNVLEEDGPSAPLHRAIIYMLFSTGIRKSELIYLKVKDYFTQGDHRVIRVKAKGGKYLTKLIHPACAAVVDAYLKHLELQGLASEKDDYLFRPTRNPKSPENLNKPLNPKSVDYIVKTITKKAGIFQRISPHSARASYIGSALEAGVDLLKVSQDVGHASVRTTQEYNKRRQKLEDSPGHNLGYFKKPSAS